MFGLKGHVTFLVPRNDPCRASLQVVHFEINFLFHMN